MPDSGLSGSRPLYTYSQMQPTSYSQRPSVHRSQSPPETARLLAFRYTVRGVFLTLAALMFHFIENDTDKNIKQEIIDTSSSNRIMATYKQTNKYIAYRNNIKLQKLKAA